MSDKTIIYLCRFQVLIVCLGRIPHGLNTLVVDVEAESNSLVERKLRLSRAIDIRSLLGTHEAPLMVQTGLNHTISNSLPRRTKMDLVPVSSTSPRHTTLAIMNSASSGDSSISFLVISTKDMRE
jgi:hypothetical protein